MCNRSRCTKTVAFSRILLIGFLTGICVLVWTYLQLSSSSLQHEDLEPYIQRFPTRRGHYLRRKTSCTTLDPCIFKIVADLDQQSRVLTSSSVLLFKSILLEGHLQYQQDNNNRILIEWNKPVEIFTKHNEGGRGLELSELVLTPNGKLLSCDDRTGLVYEHINQNGEEIVVPRYVLTEGLGDTNKGMKIEWATVKKDTTWFGSFGKEFTAPDGSIVHENNFWVATIDANGDIKRYQWKSVYDKIRMLLGASWPGYVIHEAVTWSSIHNLWVFLPRRVSSEPYNDVKDEKRGSNKMILGNEYLSSFEVRTVGKLTPERGFSAFRFIPGTQDQVILALKSEEEASTGKQRTFITAFTIQGETIMEETLVPVPYKFEGLEFLL